MNIAPKSADLFVPPPQAAGPSDKEAKPVAADEADAILKSLEETAEITDAIAAAAFKKEEHVITVTAAQLQEIEKAEIVDELKRYLKDPAVPLDFSKGVKSPSTITDCDFLLELFEKASSAKLHAIVAALVLHCPDLAILNFSGTNITSDTIALLAPLTKLCYLCVSGCQGATDKALESLKGLTALKRLDLCGCRELTSKGLQCLAALTNLEYLDLGCSMPRAREGLQHLQSLTKLRHLSLSHWYDISEAELQHLTACTELRYLDLSWCYEITETGLKLLRERNPLLRINTFGCDHR